MPAQSSSYLYLYRVAFVAQVPADTREGLKAGPPKTAFGRGQAELPLGLVPCQAELLAVVLEALFVCR